MHAILCECALEINSDSHYPIVHSAGMEPRELLQALMHRSQDTPSSLSRKLHGHPGQPQLHKYLEGIAKEPRRSTLKPVADFYEIPIDALYDAQLAATTAKRLRLDDPVGARGAHVVEEASPHYDNAEQIAPRRKVPLISWVTAGQWAEIQDTYHPGQADEWIDAVDSSPGKNAFALRVVGDSMTNPIPQQRSFPDGTIIIVDPLQVGGPGDYVIAKDIATQKATFKQLVTDGGRWFLRPLNPTFPTIEIDDPAVRVIGRVVEFRIGGKL